MNKRELLETINSTAMESEVDPEIIETVKKELIRYISGFDVDTQFDDEYFCDCVERLMPKGSWLYNLDDNELDTVEIQTQAVTDIYSSVRVSFELKPV